MDALKNLTTNIPSWLTSLDELSGQVERRQAELAAVATAEPKNGSETKSLRNKGSTESLKPKDDGPSNIPAAAEPEAGVQAPQPPNPPEPTPGHAKPSTPPQDAQRPRPSPSSPGAGGIASSHKPPRDAIAAAHSRAKAQVKKKVKTASMVSVENAPQTYRTRSMIIVYYDSYVQGFFDDLVRFVSSARNLMRKAKMAAKVAQIKKMAEMETSSREDGEDGDVEPIPSLRYMSSRRAGPMGGRAGRPGFGPPGSGDKPDVYDHLDRGLELVQSTCEHGAHQFLRDADCDEEVNKIKERLREVLEMAGKEMERVQAEESELAQEMGELEKPRARRPISIRRDMSLQKENGSGAMVPDDPAKLEAARSTHSRNSYIEPASNPAEIEVDTDDLNGDDEAIDIEAELPKLQYRSTRAMRSRLQ